jgi:ribonucleoside-triphosphate reductase (thioredoxin)
MQGTKLAADVKFLLDYAKWNKEESRPETWDEAVERVMKMHWDNPKFIEAKKDPWFISMFGKTTEAYKQKRILGSNRALQFGGAPILKHNSKMYNCLASHCDRVEFFNEAMYWLMSGCGVGYSVQHRHIDKLPNINSRPLGTKTFAATDDIEGWADCFGVLTASYFECGNDPAKQSSYSRFAQYAGYKIKFDLSGIREEGAEISGGFKAPGSEALKRSLERVEALIEARLKTGNRLTSEDIADIVCHEGDAVLSGGVRRSASICVFDVDDQAMINYKSFANFNPKAGINPQRGRVNISAVMVRGEVTWEQFQAIIQITKDQGDPGFYFVDHPDQLPNPCVEVGMWPIAPSGRSGWQGCNLCVGNGKLVTTREQFFDMCEYLAFIGTLQASYTDFKYVSIESKEIFEREALLGCGICGWMNSPELLLNEKLQRVGAQIILDTNERVAKLIGINVAARTTLSKPDGNTAVLLEAASGVHGEEAEQYFRLMQVNKKTEVAQYFIKDHSFMTENSVWCEGGRDIVMYFPIEVKKGSVLKKDLIGIKQLEIVKSIQQNWVEAGTRVDACAQPFLRHNVSNTVQVEDWDEVGKYLFDNKQYFSGVSFLSTFGPLDFKQCPFTPVRTLNELVERYGNGVVFASGLIVDGLHYFDNDLWNACEAVINKEFVLDGTRAQVLLKKDWIRRAKQFAKRYCKGKVQSMIYCLKEVYLYHKWLEIGRELKPIDLSKIDFKPIYAQANEQGSASCVGGACEVSTEFLEMRKEEQKATAALSNMDIR